MTDEQYRLKLRSRIIYCLDQMGNQSAELSSINDEIELKQKALQAKYNESVEQKGAQIKLRSQFFLRLQYDKLMRSRANILAEYQRMAYKAFAYISELLRFSIDKDHSGAMVTARIQLRSFSEINSHHQNQLPALPIMIIPLITSIDRSTSTSKYATTRRLLEELL